MSEEKKSASAVGWTFVGTLVAALLACAGTITAAAIATAPDLWKELSQVQRGTATPTIAATVSNILFQDNFGDFSSGWERSVEDTAITDYFSSGYRIYVKNSTWIAWANPHKKWADLRVEVYATKQDGPDDNAFGVICRYQDGANYYYFLVTSDGYSGILTQKNDVSKVISSEKLVETSAIRIGKATNHIRAECVGTTLTLYINGQLVASARDDAFPSGDVGLFARSYDTGGVDILFDNLVVTRP